MPCSQCEMARINGIRCHETGCPESWRDEVRSCENCGSRFKPESKGDRFCDGGCYASFYGLETDDDDDASSEERFARHRAADPHCTCPDCTDYHFATHTKASPDEAI